MTKAPDARTDPLAPLEFVVTVLSALIAILFAILIPATVFGSGSFLGIGERSACAVVTTGTVGYGVGEYEGPGPVVQQSPFIEGLHAGASFYPKNLEICDNHPTAWTKTLTVASAASDLLLLLGFLLLATILIRTARRHGLFTVVVAARVRLLGWFLLVGIVLVGLAQWAATGAVVHGAVRDVDWLGEWDQIHLSWTVLIVGLGLLTIARVLRQAVLLQDDVDATI